MAYNAGSMTTPESPFNDEVVRAARDGDAEKRSIAIAHLADPVRAMVVVRLAPSALNAHDVDDLVQESLSAISKGLNSIREPSVGTLRAFASTVVTRVVASYLSSNKNRKGRKSVSLETEVGDGSSAGVLGDLLSASGISPGSVAARREQIHNLLIQLAALKDTHRDVITMTMIDQLPVTEVAKRMGVSRPAASMLLYRAMKTLRRNVTGSSTLGDDDATHP